MGETVDQLRRIQALSDLTPVQLSMLSSFVETVRVPMGSRILSEGERTEDLYMIDSGQARVSRAGVEDHVELGPGEYFGEIAMLTGQRRTANVVAVTPMVLLRLTRAGYESYLRKASGAVADELGQTAARREGRLDAGGGPATGE